MIDIACIGHITQDHIITPTVNYFASGGTAYYIAEGMEALLNQRTFGGQKLSFQLITKEGTKHFFENKYGENMNNRQQRVLSTAEPFSFDELQDIAARFIILGSLLASDFSLDVIKNLSMRGSLVLDVQGFLREVKEENVYAVDWPEKLDALKYVDILKVNEYEMEVLTGKTDAREAALVLAEWGVKEVLLTFGSYGSLIYDAVNKVFYDIPAYEPLRIVDATGCGDTYVMGYVYKRAMGESIKDSGLFAAYVSSKKLQAAGPYSG